MLITYKAKVKLPTEEQMELEDMDLGNVSTTTTWGWRNSTLHINDIFRVTAYDRARCIIETTYGERILIKEPASSFTKRWEKMLIEFNAFPQEEVDETQGEDVPKEDQYDEEEED